MSGTELYFFDPFSSLHVQVQVQAAGAAGAESLAARARHGPQAAPA